MVIQRKQERQELAKMVRLDDDVHARLTKVAAKNETYSKTIDRLLEFYEENRHIESKK